MKSRKFRILATRNGTPVGYVKSVSYTNSKFTLTNNKEEAKTYVNEAVIQGEIDFLTGIAYSEGYIFMYD